MKPAEKEPPISDMVLKIIETMPHGFVFDSFYVVQQLRDEFPQAYGKFLSISVCDNKPNGLAAGKNPKLEMEIDRMLKTCEPALIEEVNIKIHFPTIAASLTSHRIWKKN